ncbi:MAG: murein hydrolase activator EnvC family protein [Planktomarina sp.]
MNRLAFIFGAFVAFASPLAAGPAEDAAQAAEDLRRASDSLAQVEKRRDRVQALTETISALENGMAALREGLRRAAIRKTQLERSLSARNEDITRLLGTLQSMGRTSEPTMLLHPLGPIGTARSGMLLADMTPTLQAEITVLRSQILEVQTIQDLQLSAQSVMQRGLEDLQAARVDLSAAITDRTELPTRFTEDPERAAMLIATAKTLDAFAAGLKSISLSEETAILPEPEVIKGNMTPPVLGRLVRKFNEKDASGIPRPGVLMATDPASLVRAPATATVRFQGQLLDYGNVIILEPASDTLLIFAGLGTAFAQTGEIVNQGAPLGLMPGEEAQGRPGQDRLYIEVRKDQSPENPERWFKF